MELEIQVFRREGKNLKNREEQVYRRGSVLMPWP